MDAKKGAWADYRGSGSSGSQGTGGRVWSKWGDSEPEASKVKLTAAKKDENQEAMDAWGSAHEDRGSKRRASNSGDMEVSTSPSGAAASGPGAVVPVVPVDRGGAVAPSDGSESGKQVARRWDRSGSPSAPPGFPLASDQMKEWFQEVAKTMLVQSQQSIAKEPNWSSSWWSSGSGSSTWGGAWSGSVWARDDRSDRADASEGGPDDEVRV